MYDRQQTNRPNPGNWILWLLIGLLLTSFGCKFKSGRTPGEEGQFEFYEPNTYPADKWFSQEGFDAPIAVGSEVDVSVTWLTYADDKVVGCLLHSGETEDPEILEVIAIGFGAGPNTLVRLKALKEGSTRLHINTSCSPAGSGTEVSDSVVLTTAVPTHATFTLKESPAIISSNSKGYSLRPDASVTYEAKIFRDDQLLIGFNLLEWQYDESLLRMEPTESETMTPETPLWDPVPTTSTVNTQEFTGLGISGETTVTTHMGGSRDIATLSEDDPMNMEVIASRLDLEEPSIISIPITEFTPEDTYFRLDVTDMEGRTVVPSWNDKAESKVELIEGDFKHFEVTKASSHYTIEACAGSGVVQITYMGMEATLPIDVFPGIDDSICDEE